MCFGPMKRVRVAVVSIASTITRGTYWETLARVCNIEELLSVYYPNPYKPYDGPRSWEARVRPAPSLDERDRNDNQ